MWQNEEWSDLAIWNTEFCKKLTFVYRIIIANIQTIKSMAKEAQSCCLISLSPCKQGTQVYTLGKWAETQSHSLSPLFLHSSLYTTQLDSFQCPTILMYPIQALVVTQLWSSAPLVRFPRMSWPCSGKLMGESQRHLVLNYLSPSTYVCREKPPEAQETDISALPDLRNLFVTFPPNLWTEPSGWRVPSMIILSVLLSWFLNYAPSILTKQEPRLVTTT